MTEKQSESGWTQSASEQPTTESQTTPTTEWTIGKPASDSDLKDSNPYEEYPSIRSNWWKGIVLALIAFPISLFGITVAGILWAQTESQLALGVMFLLILLFLSLRIVLPVAIYLDARKIRSAPQTSGPTVWIYLLVTFLGPPLFELGGAIIYLLRRRKHARIAAGESST